MIDEAITCLLSSVRWLVLPGRRSNPLGAGSLWGVRLDLDAIRAEAEARVTNVPGDYT
jgi:hypothetical protein